MPTKRKQKLTLQHHTDGLTRSFSIGINHLWFARLREHRGQMEWQVPSYPRTDGWDDCVEAILYRREYDERG